MSPNLTKSHILPLLVMTLAGFTFNTSELVPIGLLTDIAADFKVTEAKAGLLITVYAWVVALMSLPLMLLFARVSYRKLMLWIVGIFFISHIGSVMSTGYYSLMASRIGVALAHSLFWSIAPAMVVSVAATEKKTSALSWLVAGGSLALIAGLPLGRLLGLLLGWRFTFGVLGMLSGIVWIGIRTLFPTLKGNDSSEGRKEILHQMLGSRSLMLIYIITALMITGYYTVYSYIEPYMGQISGLGANTITATLMLFGISGMIGSVIMSRWFSGHSRFILSAACLGIPFTLLILLPTTWIHSLTICILCVLWGVELTIYNIALQNDIITLFPRNSAVPMSMYSGIFNLGIGGGAFIGGIAVEHGMLSYIGFIGGTIALVAAAVALFIYIPFRTP